MHSAENNAAAPETAPGTRSLDKRQLSEAIDILLKRTAIPPAMTRPAFGPTSANRDPQPLGIPWLDTMLTGGLAAGEVLLFLGPTGGGKTTLATKTAWLRAMQRSHAVYITYDEPLEGQINSRFWSLMTGVPRPDFEKQTIADMSPEIQRRFQAWREAYGSYLHVYDGSSARHGKGGIADIKQITADEINQGRHPSLIIVDWVQCAVLKGMGSDGGSAREISEQMDDYAKQFADICRDQRIQGILMQQLAACYQRARNVDINHRMAEACKTLGNHCHHAVGIGRLTPENEGLMISSKGISPAASRPPQLVKLNGALNKFEIPTGISDDEQIAELVARCKTPPTARANIDHADHSDRQLTYPKTETRT